MTDPVDLARAVFSLRGRNPDILTCIANLSNDEVFTPPEFANRMLDTLAAAWAADNGGTDLWADGSVRFLDPCAKSGVFLREIAKRLIKGLEPEMPDLRARVGPVRDRHRPDGGRFPASREPAHLQHRADERGGVRLPPVRGRLAPLHGHRKPRRAGELRALRHCGGQGASVGRSIEIDADHLLTSL